MTAPDHDPTAAFLAAQAAGAAFPPAFHDRLTFDQAYRIQLGVTDRRVAAGASQAGWKVAQTSAAARETFGYAEPVFGCVMADGVHPSGHVYAPGTLVQPRCEPEICVRLRADLAGPVDPATARRAIDLVYPAFEILEVRGDIGTQKALAIADNAATKDIILGTPIPLDDHLDLAAIACRFWLDDEQPHHGTGAAVLGDPLHAVTWLAAKLATFGRHLRAGDLVMTGSLTHPLPFLPGSRAPATFTHRFVPITVSLSSGRRAS